MVRTANRPPFRHDASAILRKILRDARLSNVLINLPKRSFSDFSYLKQGEFMMNDDEKDVARHEIWETVCAMNDAWTKGNADDLIKYFHPDMLAITPNSRTRVEGREACIAGWKSFAENAKIYSWKEIDPLIQIYGDSAIVSYYYEIVFELSGQMTKSEGRDMFVLIKENNRWQAVADQFSNYP